MKISEDELHFVCIQWFDLQFPNVFRHHSPNESPRGGKNVMYYHNKLDKMGRVKGYPDLLIHRAGKTVYIEFKSITGKVSPAQRECQQKLIQTGFDVYIVRTLDEFIGVINNFFKKYDE